MKTVLAFVERCNKTGTFERSSKSTNVCTEKSVELWAFIKG